MEIVLSQLSGLTEVHLCLSGGCDERYFNNLKPDSLPHVRVFSIKYLQTGKRFSLDVPFRFLKAAPGIQQMEIKGCNDNPLDDPISFRYPSLEELRLVNSSPYWDEFDFLAQLPNIHSVEYSIDFDSQRFRTVPASSPADLAKAIQSHASQLQRLHLTVGKGTPP
ncbi:hypothetical protein CSUB01_10879 [Colletotrichum sublineola]|uniref:F-box domain-containing protein n=1 Tax=Colletotrichum sublineola TaxID=1173701 RepID=A0A066XLJ3_COLSU|nr:hypothetical protein CSUB01_10879 [Colletotrichum sublineola]